MTGKPDDGEPLIFRASYLYLHMPPILSKSFYEEDPAEVAEKILGRVLVRRIGGKRLSCIIVETEAYYGPGDPASRARRGGDLKKVMFGEPGVALIYGVHGQWLLNVVAHEPGEAGAVLIRAAKPLEGVNLMKRFRGVKDERLLMSGPGRLTKAMRLDKRFHGKPVYTDSYGLWIEEGRLIPSSLICRGPRVGVSRDLPFPLRFYVRKDKALGDLSSH